MKKSTLTQSGIGRHSLVASATVLEALAPLYDRHPNAVTVVSGYDGTILYANDALARALAALAETAALRVDFVGRTLQELTELYKVPYETTTTAAAFNDGQLHIRRCGDDGSWGCSSLMPSYEDADSAIAFGTKHDSDVSEDAAREEHLRLRKQASVAIEFCEAERLIQVGMEALHRARQRIDRFRGVLLTLNDD